MPIQRLFGYKEDATAGGSGYDDLEEGKVPNADKFWPVTGGDLDKGVERVDRNAEVRGRRAATAPLPFKARPQMTIPVPAYRTVVETGVKKTLGGADTVTGAGEEARTHSIASLDYPATALPAVYTQMVRDALNQKMSGGVFNRMSLNFPIDGEGTCEFEIAGLYLANFEEAAPTASFTGLPDDVLMLRDAEVFIDGAVESIDDLQGFEFSFNNNVNPHHSAKRNVVTEVLGTPEQTKKLWFPSENRINAAQDVTFAINMGNVSSVQELAHDFAQIEKFVFECSGGPLATTPAANELLRITIYSGVLTGGGADALAARDDLTSRFEGAAFYSISATDDVKIEVVNSTATAIK